MQFLFICQILTNEYFVDDKFFRAKDIFMMKKVVFG